MPQLSNRVNTFTDSVIRRMTRISDKHGAINLSQGFPDFPPPKAMTDALSKIALEGPHQYSVTFGAPNLREAIAKKQSKAFNRDIDFEKEVLVTCGGTEAMMCAMMTVCNPGDKVIVFSPFYENYGADAILSGAEPIYVPLIPPNFNFDVNVLEDAFKQNPKALILCNPSNPTGKVFTKEELMIIAELAVKYDTFVITDEVYEHLIYEPYKHTYFAYSSWNVRKNYFNKFFIKNIFYNRMETRIFSRSRRNCRMRKKSPRLFNCGCSFSFTRSCSCWTKF